LASHKEVLQEYLNERGEEDDYREAVGIRSDQDRACLLVFRKVVVVLDEIEEHRNAEWKIVVAPGTRRPASTAGMANETAVDVSVDDAAGGTVIIAEDVTQRKAIDLFDLHSESPPG